MEHQQKKFLLPLPPLDNIFCKSFYKQRNGIGFEKQRIKLDSSKWGREKVDNKYLTFWSELAEASLA